GVSCIALVLRLLLAQELQERLGRVDLGGGGLLAVVRDGPPEAGAPDPVRELLRLVRIRLLGGHVVLASRSVRSISMRSPGRARDSMGIRSCSVPSASAITTSPRQATGTTMVPFPPDSPVVTPAAVAVSSAMPADRSGQEHGTGGQRGGHAHQRPEGGDAPVAAERQAAGGADQRHGHGRHGGEQWDPHEPGRWRHGVHAVEALHLPGAHVPAAALQLARPPGHESRSSAALRFLMWWARYQAAFSRSSISRAGSLIPARAMYLTQLPREKPSSHASMTLMAS